MSVATIHLSESCSIQGNLLEDGVRTFHFPYATVPKRWRAAKPVSLWCGTLDARKLRPESPQPKDLFFGQPVSENPVYDEFNCLNLDVVSPPPAKDGKLYPCMIWIHGGSFRNKSGGAETYDATKLVQHSIEIGRPVVVVNVTYRLNMLGFFSCSDIQRDVKEAGEKVFGSWGVDDISIATQWVKQHIHRFGGDPDRMTGFGESAGAIILHHLLLKPQPLFTRVILQSGVQSVKPAVPPSFYDRTWKRLLDHFKATTVDDMRKIPAEELAQTAGDFGVDFRPILDGAISNDPVSAYRAKGVYDTLEALLIGDNTDEGTLWSRFGDYNALYKGENRKMPVELQDRFHSLYPPQALQDPDTALPMLDQMMAETKFHCPTERTVNAVVSLNPNTKVYRYRLDRYSEVTKPLGMMKHHGVDLFYVFLNSLLTPSELEVAKQIVGHWVAFAYGKDLEAEAGWKQYDLKSKLCMVYGEEANEVKSIESTQNAEHYQFWQDVEDAKSKRRGTKARL